MKALKILAIVVGGIVVLGAVLVAVALIPSVQTWAVRKAVAGQPGTTIEVTRVAAGFSAADVTDFRYIKDGMIVTAKGVSAKYSAMDYLTKNRINADSVTINELVIDLRDAKPAASSSAATPSANPSAAGGSSGAPSANAPARPSTTKTATAEKPQPFEGILKQAQLPFDVRVAKLTAKGRALLPNNQLVTFELNGAGIETGQRGKLEWTIDFADSTTNAALRAMRVSGNAGIHIANDHRIDLVEIDTIASPMGPKLPSEQIKITLKAEKPTATGDETYAADIGLVRGTTLESLLKANAQYLSASREIAGAWELALRANQLAALLTGLGLPEFSANGAGKFSARPDSNAVAASGDLQAQTTQLQKLVPELATMGAVQLKTSFDAGMADNLARLDKLNLEVAGADGRKFAEIRSLQKVSYSLADKRVTLADPKAELARVSLQSLPLAWAQPFAKGVTIESGDLSLVLAVEAEPDGSRVRARAVEPLTLRTVTIRQGDKKFADRVTLTLRPNIDYSAAKITAQLAELNATMPAGDAVTGNLSADVTNFATTPAIAFAAQLQAKVVTAHKPYLPIDTGPLAIAANVEGRHEGQTLHLTKVAKTINRDGGKLLAALDLQQPIQTDLQTLKFTIGNPNNTAARIRLGEVPLAWAEAFVEKSKFAGSVTSATLDVALRSIEDLTLTTAEPIALRGVTATIDGKALAQALDLSANFTATKRGETIVYDVRKVEVKQGNASLAALNVAGEAKLGGTKLTAAAKGNLEADAAALMTQPVLAPYATLSRGRLTAAFEANLADATQAKAVISAKNLVAKQDNRALGDLEMTLDANLKPDGSGTIALPLTLTNANQKSDVSFTGAFGKAANKDTFLFTGKLASNNLVVDDFRPLAALAPAASSPSAAEKPKPTATPPPRTTPPPRSPTPPVATMPAPTRDTKPFWSAVNGKFEVDLKRVLYGKDNTISGIRGSAIITDTRLSLDGLEGKFKDNPFKIAAGINFLAQQAKPYALNGSVDVSGVDIGEILKATNPSQPPQIETTVRVVAKLSGNGATITDLADNAMGVFDVTGGSGTLRLLGGRTGQATSALSALAGLGGALAGSGSTVAAANLLRELTNMPFEQFSMHVERGADLNLRLTSIEFISPSTRMTGSGSITHQPNVPIAKQPLQIEMKLAGKKHMRRMLDEARVMDDQPDEKGYVPMRASFKVQGTASQMDDDLKTVIGKTALQMGLELFNRPREPSSPRSP